MTELGKEIAGVGNVDNLLILLKQLVSIQNLHDQEYGSKGHEKKQTKKRKKPPKQKQKIEKESKPPKKKKKKEQTIKIEELSDLSFQFPSPAHDIDISIEINDTPLSPDHQGIKNIHEFGFKTEDLPVKRKTRNSNRNVPLEKPTKSMKHEDSPLFSTTDTVLTRCIKRRARPTGRAFAEEFLSCEERNSTMINYSDRYDHRLDRAQQIQELGMIQRLIMELDLCLRLAAFTFPINNPFPLNSSVKKNPGAVGERRPFLSIRGIKKLKECRTIPHLMKGDIIHVPYTPEEQLFIIRNLSSKLVDFLERNPRLILLNHVEPFRTLLEQLYLYLPGRSVDDCMRWLQTFVNQRFYLQHPERLSEVDKELYEEQDKLHVYSPREASVLLTTNPRTTKNASLRELLVMRDTNSIPTNTFQTKLFKNARQRAYDLQYTIAGATSEIIDVKIDPTGRKQIAICSSKIPKELLLFDIATSKYHALEGHQKTVSRIAYARGGDILVSASYDKTVRVWETKTGAQLHNFERQTVTEVTQDGQQYQVQIPGHSGEIISLARGNYHYDHIVVTGDSQKGLFIWDVYQHKNLAGVYGSDSSNAEWPGPVLELEFIAGFHPEWLVTGTDCIQGGNGPGVVQIWDASRASILHCYKNCKRYVSCLQGSMDGNHVICGSADQNCYLYDIRTRDPVTILKTLLEGSLDVNSVTFSPCERFVTCSGEDNQTLVFDRRNYKLLHILCHSRPAAYQAQQGVTSAKWVNETSLLITGGEDGVNIWDLESAKPLVASYRSHTAPVSCLERSEYFLVSGGDDSLVNIYSDRSSSVIC